MGLMMIAMERLMKSPCPHQRPSVPTLSASVKRPNRCAEMENGSASFQSITQPMKAPVTDLITTVTVVSMRGSHLQLT